MTLDINSSFSIGFGHFTPRDGHLLFGYVSWHSASSTKLGLYYYWVTHWGFWPSGGWTLLRMLQNLRPILSTLKSNASTALSRDTCPSFHTTELGIRSKTPMTPKTWPTKPHIGHHYCHMRDPGRHRGWIQRPLSTKHLLVLEDESRRKPELRAFCSRKQPVTRLRRDKADDSGII